jgi:hypothetical protein
VGTTKSTSPSPCNVHDQVHDHDYDHVDEEGSSLSLARRTPL